MTLASSMIAIWAVLAVCFLALLVYRGQLTRYEDEQLFLNTEETSPTKAQQTSIVRRVRKIEPLVRGFGGAAGIMTASIIGIYVWEKWQAIQ